MNIKKTAIPEVLKELYSDDVLSGWTTFEGPLYYYFQETCSCYRSKVNSIADKDFCINSNDIYLKGEYTKKRLLNLVDRIIEVHLRILQYCYKGDLFYAYKLLYQLLLCQNSKLSQYLIEPYINYMDSNLIMGEKYYRIRVEKIGKSVDNCSHVPYNSRGSIDSNRFSLQGLPCLYLANSIETADKETHELNEGMQKWCGEFVPIKNFAVTDLSFRGLKIRSDMDVYDAFKLLITFPMRLLCSLKVKDNCHRFHEEYLFPQLLSHLILVYLKEHPNDKLYNGTEGIKFDSTQNENGFNLIIPALYTHKEPPKFGHSPKIKELFEEQEVSLLKK